MPRLRREAEPLKMTSVMSPPRRLLADCSPRAHLMASTTLLLPLPLGPMIPVRPSAKSKKVLSANDLKPTSSRRLSIRAPQTGTRREGPVLLCVAGVSFATPATQTNSHPHGTQFEDAPSGRLDQRLASPARRLGNSPRPCFPLPRPTSANSSRLAGCGRASNLAG